MVSTDMGSLICTLDWSQTPLGPRDAWPQSLKSLVDLVLASPMPMNLLWGPDLVQIYNDGFRPFFGTRHPVSLGQPTNKCWAEFQHENDLIQRRVLAGEAVVLENRPWTYARDGSSPEEAYFTSYFTPVRDESGAVAGILTSGFETTHQVKAEAERMRAEQALQANEARLQAAVNLVELSSYAWDPAINTFHWDTRLKAMWGLPPDAHVDTEVWMAGIHPEDRPRVEAAVAECSDPEGDGIYHIEYRVIGIQDGIERWISTHGQAFFDRGQPVWFVGAAIDITEHKRAEEAQRESEEQFRRFAEHSTNVLWTMDVTTGRLEYLSPAFERVWGEAPGVMLLNRRRWAETIHPDDRATAIAALKQVRLQGEAAVQDYRIIRPDGSVRQIRDTLFPIRDEQGAVCRVGGIAEDVTKHEGVLVYVVNTDEAARKAVVLVLQGAGYKVQSFLSTKAFLDIAPSLQPGCVVLDLPTVETSELAVPKNLKARQIDLPVIVINRQGDVALAVAAMKAGAVDFLETPYEPERLLSAIAAALASIRGTEVETQATALATAQISRLSPRERQVLDGIVLGHSNKMTGIELQISPRTVEVHRKRMMDKLGAESLSEALRIALAAGLKPKGSIN